MWCKVCGVRRASKLCVIPQKRARRRQKPARRSRRRLHVVAHASRHVHSPGLLGFVRIFAIPQFVIFAILQFLHEMDISGKQFSFFWTFLELLDIRMSCRELSENRWHKKVWSSNSAKTTLFPDLGTHTFKTSAPVFGCFLDIYR